MLTLIIASLLAWIYRHPGRDDGALILLLLPLGLSVLVDGLMLRAWLSR